MARKLYTVKELADSVRSRIDELNRDTIDDARDILPALNRALEYAVDIYARQYPDPYITSSTIPLVQGTTDYALPEDAYEDRVVKVDLLYSGTFTYQDLIRISYRDIANYETGTNTTEPYYYAVVGRNVKVVPTPSGDSSLRIWYVKNPDELVLPQGRITVVKPSLNYIIVDNVGTDISTESDELANYINIVNARTGEIRGTFQVASVDDGRIYIRTNPTGERTEVLGRPLSTSLADLGIKPDDYVCLAAGTCVPYLASPTSNFLIQFAVAELSRQLGLNSAEEEQVLEKFEKQVKTTWSGREPTARIKKRSVAFGTTARAWPLRQKGGDVPNG